MFKTIEGFLNVWKEKSDGTAKILAALTEESLSQSVAEGHRTLGRIAWHVVTTIPEMMGKTGIHVASVHQDAPMVSTVEEIRDGYAAVTGELAEAIRANWTNADLEVEDEMYGSRWMRGFTCRCLIEHEIHHVGQISVLMRQAGLRVPGLFGPSKEDWAKFGMTEPEL